MSKPFSVPEDEVLKYYRLKNLSMPPEAVELTDIDQDMSAILNRTDLSPKLKTQLYHRALLKYINLYKDLISFSEPEPEQESEDINKSEPPPEPLPKPTFPKEINKMSDVPPVSYSGEAEDLEQILIDKAKTKFAYKQNFYSLLFPGEKARLKIPKNTWITVMNFLTSQINEDEPKFNNRRKSSLIQKIMNFLIQTKTVSKKIIKEKYPNFHRMYEKARKAKDGDVWIEPSPIKYMLKRKMAKTPPKSTSKITRRKALNFVFKSPSNAKRKRAQSSPDDNFESFSEDEDLNESNATVIGEGGIKVNFEKWNMSK